MKFGMMMHFDFLKLNDGTVQMLIGVHIGTTWQIRLNHPCAAEMQPYVMLR